MTVLSSQVVHVSQVVLKKGFTVCFVLLSTSRQQPCVCYYEIVTVRIGCAYIYVDIFNFIYHSSRYYV